MNHEGAKTRREDQPFVSSRLRGKTMRWHQGDFRKGQRPTSVKDSMGGRVFEIGLAFQGIIQFETKPFTQVLEIILTPGKIRRVRSFGQLKLFNFQQRSEELDGFEVEIQHAPRTALGMPRALTPRRCLRSQSNPALQTGRSRPRFSTEEKVGESTEERQKENHQRPNDLHGGIESRIRQGVDEHPEPEQGEDDGQRQGESPEAEENAGRVGGCISNKEERIHMNAWISRRGGALAGCKSVVHPSPTGQ